MINFHTYITLLEILSPPRILQCVLVVDLTGGDRTDIASMSESVIVTFFGYFR
jgi:hypothetical protein